MGRPAKVISKERLEGLLRLKVPVSRIAADLQVSRQTVYKAMTEYNLIQQSRYTNISETDIRHAVSSIKGRHPNAGEVMLEGHLRAEGIHVQRSKVRKAIHDLDPSVTSRKRPAIQRRVYSVPYPNYLWHLDGNHKLIRWRFVVHHCIDGFSRLITFCRCSTNNKAETILSSYAAVRKYCRPRRIRSDHGGENVLVWRDMNSAWGEDTRPVIVGSSVHNQRIERHNRSANEQELSVFKSEFYDLEREGVLDPLNETDLFCLHYVYLPRLNKNLSEFVSAHNNHKVSTEGNNTPAQIFWTNLHLTFFGDGREPNDAWMGVNIDELIQTNLPHVQVPVTSNPLDDTEYAELQRLVDPLSSTCGKELYRNTVDFVGRKLSGHLV